MLRRLALRSEMYLILDVSRGDSRMSRSARLAPPCTLSKKRSCGLSLFSEAVVHSHVQTTHQENQPLIHNSLLCSPLFFSLSLSLSLSFPSCRFRAKKIIMEFFYRACAMNGESIVPDMQRDLCSVPDISLSSSLIKDMIMGE